MEYAGKIANWTFLLCLGFSAACFSYKMLLQEMRDPAPLCKTETPSLSAGVKQLAEYTKQPLKPRTKVIDEIMEEDFGKNR